MRFNFSKTFVGDNFVTMSDVKYYTKIFRRSNQQERGEEGNSSPTTKYTVFTLNVYFKWMYVYLDVNKGITERSNTSIF